jgi:hypothetical protein
MQSVQSQLCRIYYFKADMPVSGNDSDNKVRVLGGNMGWTEAGSDDYRVKIKNLCAARNAAGKISQCVFTSECFGERDVNEVVQSLLGASYPAGLYEF